MKKIKAFGTPVYLKENFLNEYKEFLNLILSKEDSMLDGVIFKNVKGISHHLGNEDAEIKEFIQDKIAPRAQDIIRKIYKENLKIANYAIYFGTKDSYTDVHHHEGHTVTSLLYLTQSEDQGNLFVQKSWEDRRRIIIPTKENDLYLMDSNTLHGSTLNLSDFRVLLLIDWTKG